MAFTIKQFNNAHLSNLAIIVGCLHILGSIWNSIEPAYNLIIPNADPEFSNVYYYESIFTIVGCLVIALVAALLITGVHKKQHLLMLPWLVIDGLLLVNYVILTAYNIRMINIALSVIIFLFIGMGGYVWFAILTLYRNIRYEKLNSIQDEKQKLYSEVDPEPGKVKSFSPPYFIPIEYSFMNQSSSLIKY